MFSRVSPNCFQNESSCYRELARIAGSIISVALAVGPFSRLLTRQTYLAVDSRSAWDHTFCFPSALLHKLKFWFNNIKSFNGYSIGPPPPPPLLFVRCLLFSFTTRAAQPSEAFRLPRRLCGQRYVLEFLNVPRPPFGLFYVMDFHGHSSRSFLCFLPYTVSFWKAQVRCRSMGLTRPFFAVAQNSECWLCVWILGSITDSIFVFRA